MAAGNTTFDSPHLHNTNSQIPTADMLGPDSSIPLSPQWLLSKPGESKTGTLAGEGPTSPFPTLGNRMESMKSPGIENHAPDSQKKKDVFRPSVLDSREKWRDEERETSNFVRKDRWREGDKEVGVGDNRKVDRWGDNSSGKHYVEPRHAPSEKWGDSGNKDANSDQVHRRESKWNTRWGPGDKETDVMHDHDISHEREADHPRPWRSNSALNRGKADPSQHQIPGFNKPTPMFSHGRGRGDHYNPTFSASRGRGAPVGNDDTSPMRYSRTKLLDVYRTTDMKACGMVLDGVVPVPSLTQEEVLEPLALSSPTPEELFILKGIDKGDILSSGAPQINKDGSGGVNVVDAQSRRTKLGSREDMPLASDNYREEASDNYARNDDKGNIRESKMPGQPGTPWRSLSIGQRGQPNSADSRDVNSDTRSWSQPQKDVTNEWSSSRLTNPVIGRQPPGIVDREDTRIISQPSPEDLVLFYKDPQGAIQGPFTGSDIIGWFEAGYFGIDLLVRLANAPQDSPFALLGDVMPHLRAKTKAPPGFTAAKQNEVNDEPITSNFITTSSSKVQAGLGEHAMMNHDPIIPHAPNKEAENRFIESLMNGRVSEGMQGYFGNTSSVPVKGTESGDNLFQLAKLMQLERQNSSSDPYSLWSGSGSKPDVRQDTTIPQSNMLLNPSNPEFMSILQGLSDRPTSSVNSWSNFPVQGGPGLDPLHGKQFPVQPAFGVQQRLPTQNLPPQPNLRFDNPSLPLTPEQLLSSGLPQDQILSLLQQQHMSQMKPQIPVPTQHLSVLDDYLLLKQQQQQQEQLQQMMRQQLLSQVLKEQQTMQRFGEQSCGPVMTPGLSVGSPSLDHLVFSPLETLQNHQLPNMPATVSHMHAVSPQDTVHLPHQLMDYKTQQYENYVQKKESPVDLKAGENGAIPCSNGSFFSEATDQYEKPLVVEAAEHNENLEELSADIIEPSVVQSEPSSELGVPKEEIPFEAREVKKATEKKSKKQKSLNAQQSSDMIKSAPKTQQSESELAKVNEAEVGENKSNVVIEEHVSMSSDFNQQVYSGQQANTQAHSGQQAWKPAPGFKPKSFLEIQQEEQRRAQAQAQSHVHAETAVSEVSASFKSMSMSTTPWAGVVGNSDNKHMETKKELTASEVSHIQQQQNKSLLHAHLAEEVPMKSGDKNPAPSDFIDDGNFIEAKESKRSRKKSAKAKAAGGKVSLAVSSVETSVISSPNEKSKSSRQEKDVLPAVPSGPSLGDFVLWKGETAIPSPAPAWSTDSGKISRPTSLRDILKEQDRKVSSQMQVPAATQKSVSSAKAASPVKKVSQSKTRVDDDLFWGPLDHPKQETKGSDFPQLANQGGRAKNTPGKGNPISRQKSTSLSSSPALNGKQDVLAKRSEAIDFRDWCKSECVRLLGSKDTSFLEFCLKQSRSEAEILLKENLGSYDPDHEFIDKFLNYKDFLPSDVLEIAFQSGNDHLKASGDLKSVNDGLFWDPEVGGSAASNKAVAVDGGSAAKGGGGKKKGKKGKKMSSALLGFNVVSNRIMMGEIETIDD